MFILPIMVMSYMLNMTVNKNKLEEKLTHKVLVVDDSPIISNLIKDVLTVENYEVCTAENGAQALDMYAKFRPDIVTLDISMPVMDGYETLTRLLKLDRDAQIIIISGFEHELLQRCLEKGAAGYLMKPFNNEQLVISIKNLLKSGCDKNTIALFYCVSQKIEAGIKKLLDSEASVILKDVSVTKENLPQYSSQDLSQIRAVPKIMKPLGVQVPEGAVGYVCEFNGVPNGLIISFIKTGYLEKLFGSPDTKGKDSPDAFDLFNMINCKVLSSFIENTNLNLNSQPSELYDPSKFADKVWKTITKAIFEIKSTNRLLPFEIQMLTSM